MEIRWDRSWHSTGISILWARGYPLDIDPVPAKFVFLKNTDLIQNRMPEGEYVLVVLDCSNPGRMGWSPLLNHRQLSILIITGQHKIRNVNIVETTAAATGEIIYKFFT